jgi:L-ascorbate metabolism protein UlaG (beta-lactamase superfamily)
VRLTWFGHSTVLVEFDGARVLTDPVLRKRVLHLRRHAAVDVAAIGRVDGIVVSHGHWDHFDVSSLVMLGRSVRLVVPRGLGGPLRRRGWSDVVELEAGQDARIGDLAVRATPAAHGKARRLFAWQSAALGYLLTGSRRVYFAGDTDLFQGMADLAPVDVALLPVWGWGPRLPSGHLDPQLAAETLTLLRPQVAVPIHWGTFTPWRVSASDRRPAEAFASAAAEVAPDVDVIVPTLGEAFELSW